MVLSGIDRPRNLLVRLSIMARARNLVSRYDDEEEVIGTGGRETGQ